MKCIQSQKVEACMRHNNHVSSQKLLYLKIILNFVFRTEFSLGCSPIANETKGIA